MTLVRGLSERDAQELGSQLNRRGIAVSIIGDGSGDGHALHVSQSSVPLAWDAIAPLERRSSRSDADNPASAPLIPTREADQQAQERALALRLSSAIDKLPGVLSAEVVVSLPRTRADLRDLLESTSTPETRAVASILVDSNAPQQELDQKVRALLIAAVPDLTHSTARVVISARTANTSACAPLSHVGPLTLTRQSLPMLKLWIGASLVVHMLASLALLFVLRRRRSKPGHGATPRR